MKKYLLSKTIAAIVLAVSFTSCDAILDQDETDFGKGPVLTTFTQTEAEVNIIKDAANTPKTFSFDISYAGGKNVALDRDVTVTIATKSTSEAKEGVEFELPVKTFTIPAGQTSAQASVKILTAGLVPFDFKDIVLEIVDSSESVAEINTITITVKALGANSLAGRYEVLEGTYFRIGVNTPSSASPVGATRVIEALSETLYKHTEYVGNFPGNNWYFTVDANDKVTVLTKDPFTGAPTLLNGVAAISCETNPSSLTLSKCGTSNVVERTNNRKDVIKLTVGYNPAAPREFYEVIRRLE
ncbi:hypothetical protein [Flavobacterium turcicum]|uniref:Calx-beta domain-containing protein n=1 Tax=Flavobacterium turcicum TaxID=2764718 RepID=A0ABR7JI80_9FLAO|nr:hypothetical protein [Flavobacterium turcicum]MBC5864162.1 hypothetical protein [Flavobacterium turcicum]NHL03068.1 hypothetical protein [Flavobacterium turcicum]